MNIYSDIHSSHSGRYAVTTFLVSKMKIDFHQGEEGEGDYTVYECPGLASVTITSSSL